MPYGEADHPAVRELRRRTVGRGWSRREIAKRLDLNHSLITRAMAGKPITAANAERIMSRLDRLDTQVAPAMSVSLARDLLHMMLEALDAYKDNPRNRR
ncbi:MULTISPECIES: hypothetical protein [unclassified Bradyrhizobium]|uniref:hypothetical protein n=2 Tax=Bradyrhizobium TaxID=374 RepID=UPI0028E61DDE|nr:MULTISPECIES: hypothetical protein [unclassified Bradyrhizobium]